MHGKVWMFSHLIDDEDIFVSYPEIYLKNWNYLVKYNQQKFLGSWVSGNPERIRMDVPDQQSRSVKEDRSIMNEEFFDNENWYIRLLMEATDRTVENTAEIQKQEMKDDVTKVLISKQDIAGKELSGAKLTILDEDGKVVESWTSTEEAHYIEMLPIGKYTLREETAPEGYLVAKDVEFEVKDTAEVQKVVMVDEEKPKESTPEGGKPSKDAPKTGDNTNLLLWLIVLGMSLSGVVVLGRKIKKK